MPFLPSAVAAASSTSFDGTARFVGCHDQFNAFSVPVHRAQIRDGDAGNDRVPEHYTIRPTLEGEEQTAVFGLTILRCDSVTVKDTVSRGVSLTYGAFDIEPPAGAEHDPRADLPGDTYLQFISTDSKPLADWLRAGTGLELNLVPLDYEYTMLAPAGVAPFSFEALAPPDWAFTVDGAASAQMLGDPTLYVDDNYWRDTKTPDGKTFRTRLVAPYHADWVAPAAVTVTATTPGSELHEILAPEGWPADLRYPAAPTLAVSARQGAWDMTKAVFRK
jgi:hypothetical protein